MSTLKHMLFDALIEPLDQEQRPQQFNYSTFRYKKKRKERWREMENFFRKMIGTVLTDVSNFGVSMKKPQQEKSKD